MWLKFHLDLLDEVFENNEKQLREIKFRDFFLTSFELLVNFNLSWTLEFLWCRNSIEIDCE